MQFKQLHPNFQLPTEGTAQSGAYDLYMPTTDFVRESENGNTKLVGLGFAAKVPEGCVALILPRSGAGAKHGVELRNTVGVIDADYPGEWKVAVKTKEGHEFGWAAGERLFQYLIVPVVKSTPYLVDELDDSGTGRTAEGFGSTGQ